MDLFFALLSRNFLKPRGKNENNQAHNHTSHISYFRRPGRLANPSGLNTTRHVSVSRNEAKKTGFWPYQEVKNLTPQSRVLQERKEGGFPDPPLQTGGEVGGDPPPFPGAFTGRKWNVFAARNAANFCYGLKKLLRWNANVFPKKHFALPPKRIKVDFDQSKPYKIRFPIGVA